MRNFQGTFGTRKRLFISAFSICMNAPLAKTRLKIIGTFRTLLNIEDEVFSR